jgi:hypothetical protein
MRHLALVGSVAILCAGCGLLPGGGGLGSLLPTADLGIAGTPAFPAIGTFDTGAFLTRPTIVGSVLDPYVQAVPGVVICYGPDEADASAVSETDPGGAYSAALPSDEDGARQVWAYLPLYRFEPDRVQVQGILLGELTVDFVAFPSIYPVPPERDCR